MNKQEILKELDFVSYLIIVPTLVVNYAFNPFRFALESIALSRSQRSCYSRVFTSQLFFFFALRKKAGQPVYKMLTEIHSNLESFYAHSLQDELPLQPPIIVSTHLSEMVGHIEKSYKGMEGNELLQAA